MVRNVEATFEGAVVLIAGNDYERCTFKGCTIVFTGENLVGLAHCTFLNCAWSFDGPARNTIDFLRGMYHGMDDVGRDLVKDLFAQIERGDPLPGGLEEPEDA